jgi:uncharacterized protein YfbU (UPF0304 family)
MKLSRTERWILANQFRILEKLYPDEADSYAKSRETLECGYELHYRDLAEPVYEEGLSEEGCNEVIEIMAMFESLKRAYEGLSDKSEINEWEIKFAGFDGNNEGSQMAYARYFCTYRGERFTSIDKGDNFNSHIPTLAMYRRMMDEWRNSRDKYNLSKEDILRIASARKLR